MLDKATNEGGDGAFETPYDITIRRFTIIPIVHTYILMCAEDIDIHSCVLKI